MSWHEKYIDIQFTVCVCESSQPCLLVSYCTVCNASEISDFRTFFLMRMKVYKIIIPNGYMNSNIGH